MLLLLVAPKLPAPHAAGMVDGDTLRLDDGRRVRLPGIDAPESGRPLADEATRFGASLLARGPMVLVPDDPPLDRYGRLLADVRVGRHGLSEDLVSAGLAWVGTAPDATLLARQGEAVRARRGIHAELDALRGPFVVTAERFHAPDCPFLRGRTRALPFSASAAPLLTSGRAPCRTCLPWPPRRLPFSPPAPADETYPTAAKPG